MAMAIGQWMKRLTLIVAFSLLLLSQSFAEPVIQDARLGVHSDKTRFVIEVNEQVPYEIFTIANPDRLVIDLPEVTWSQKPNTASFKRGAVEGFRSGLFRAGVSRIVLDLTEEWHVKNHFRLSSSAENGHRIVIDLAPGKPESTVTAALKKQASPDWQAYVAKIQKRESIQTPSQVAPQKNGKKVIVLDPGHGGVDPGAIGVTGTYEKDVVLATAKAIAKKLERTGRYKVVLTRDRDIFIPLRKRYARAEAYHGDIFISIHADAHSRRDIRGATIYTLSNRGSDKEAERLAAKENKSDIIAGQDLSGFDSNLSAILIDMAQGSTNRLSWQFAEDLVTSMKSQVSMRKNPHRFAGFAVLKSPNIPSVLMELGYLSNTKDEAMLKTSAYQAKIATSIVKALDQHFKQLDRLSRS